VQITTFSVSNYPAQNATVQFPLANANNRVGSTYNNTSPFDGYLAEVNFIDGQALTPSSFGAYDATTGVWQPARYTGTYGTNGFYLKFASFGTAADLGTDSSGNGNTWTVNNLSVTAGVTYDPMTDVPTLTSATVANYPVLNPLTYRTTYSHTVPTNGNLTCSSDANFRYFTATMSSAGSYYFEMNVTTNAGTGSYIAIWQAENPQSGATFSGYGSDGSVYVNGSLQTTVATYTTGDIVAFAHNTSAGTVGVYKNGTLLTTATGVQTALAMYPGCLCGAGSVLNMNFGQRPFAYTAPSGFVALNAYNLPTPTINNGASYMAATTYTGTGAVQSISDGANTTTNVTFQPDLVWIKSRSAATNNNVFDSLRTATNYLITNSTAANATNANTLTAFNSTGFALGTDASSIGVNISANTYVAWQWLAGAGTSSTNTAGSITSTVSVNATAGFSVVTYTGTGANATVGHGLGVAPSMVIVKNRISTTQNWNVWFSGFAGTDYILLNTIAASAGPSGTLWNSTVPSSTVFSVGTANGTNGSTNGMVAYCWSAVAGYSAFGSYTGNGSTDGPFIYTGFRSRFILIKVSSTTGNWRILDTSRDTYNVESAELYPSLANAETAFASLDGLSNGFKIRNTDTAYNNNGSTYIYAAFAENPFKYALAR
jgi:hypothetical protein